MMDWWRRALKKSILPLLEAGGPLASERARVTSCGFPTSPSPHPLQAPGVSAEVAGTALKGCSELCLSQQP